jgi:hypothetical protein
MQVPIGTAAMTTQHFGAVFAPPHQENAPFSPHEEFAAQPVGWKKYSSRTPVFSDFARADAARPLLERRVRDLVERKITDV